MYSDFNPFCNRCANQHLMECRRRWCGCKYKNPERPSPDSDLRKISNSKEQSNQHNGEIHPNDTNGNGCEGYKYANDPHVLKGSCDLWIGILYYRI